jgi:hypothetical protein
MNYGNIALPPSQCAEIQKLLYGNHSEDNSSQPAYAATLTPAIVGASTIYAPAALTGALTLAAPTGDIRLGARLTVVLTQDATGGRVTTWNAIYKKAADGAGTGNQKAATTFVWDGTNWVQEAGAIVFK